MNSSTTDSPGSSAARPASSRFLVYGAYGYTGELVCDEALRLGLSPWVSGRDPERLAAMAEPRGLRHRPLSLDDAAGLDEALSEVDVVLHCAGPFSKTFRPMIESCLRTGTHYLDITGEWQVFQAAAERDAAARDKGIMVMPGVGFDVVPSDCLAAYLHGRLPDGTALSLGFQMVGRASRGTRRTALEGLTGRGYVRREGALRSVPAAWLTRTIDFGRGPRLAATIPWGDIVTAWHTTGIPDIEVFMAAPPSAVRTMKISRWLGPLIQTGFVQRRMLRKIDSSPAGPDAGQRANGRSLLWGEIRNTAGDSVVARLSGPEGYSLTAATAIRIVERVLGGDLEAGFQTPGGHYGADFVLEVEGVERHDGERMTAAE
ncbi:MAG: saccharopine dehydrogenase NADP-binding domain-containing protein [Thermoanaerobaculia bacterium]|nr:saccharopine dehydrogenase NADP-binding domain-containing protein [Thermoanaerobaculia bacterium]